MNSPKPFNPRCAKVLFTLALVVGSGVAAADGFDMFSQHEEMKGHVVLAAGDFEIVARAGSTPAGGVEMVKINLNCFRLERAPSSWLHGKKAGLLLVDHNKQARVALIEDSIGFIKVQTIPAERVKCP